MKCDPLEIRRTPRPGRPDAIEWACSRCAFRGTDRRGHFPAKLHRTCDVQQPPPLNAAGRWLIRLQPGDRLAWAARVTGGAALMREWEQISGRPCRCGDRQRWLNRQWRQLVFRHFARPE